MPEAQIANSVQLLGLLLEFFADDGHWTRGCYDDGNGGHCLVGTLLHLSRKHRLPTAPVIALLQDAMPRLGLPLVHFNDTHCGCAAELRSVILRARRLAHDDAERERAAATVKTWLFAQVEKKRERRVRYRVGLHHGARKRRRVGRAATALSSKALAIPVCLGRLIQDQPRDNAT